MKKTTRKNWIVLLYNGKDEIIDKMRIADRTEDEAQKEAESYVENCALTVEDWTLSQTK